MTTDTEFAAYLEEQRALRERQRLEVAGMLESLDIKQLRDVIRQALDFENPNLGMACLEGAIKGYHQKNEDQRRRRRHVR